jgi:hypothetical protein
MMRILLRITMPSEHNGTRQNLSSNRPHAFQFELFSIFEYFQEIKVNPFLRSSAGAGIFEMVGKK